MPFGPIDTTDGDKQSVQLDIWTNIFIVYSLQGISVL